MSRMSKPEARVVRFHERDVIVASALTSVQFFNYANSKSYDGRAVINGTVYSSSHNNSYYNTDLFVPYNLPSDPDIQVTGTEQGKYIPLSTLMTNDANSINSGVLDGTYEWNSTYNVFEYRQ